MEKTTLSWENIDIAADTIAHALHDLVDTKNIVVMSPHYGGWPVAAITINKLRHWLNDDKFKPTVLTESELTRHFLVPLLSHKHIVIFDDVLDTGKVINGIIWRIIHECETFIPLEEIINKINAKRENQIIIVFIYLHMKSQQIHGFPFPGSDKPCDIF